MKSLVLLFTFYIANYVLRFGTWLNDAHFQLVICNCKSNSSDNVLNAEIINDKTTTD